MVSCITLDMIQDVEEVQCEKVYDITVDNAHNYFLDCGKPILVHNSSKTYSIAQKFIIELMNRKNESVVYSVVRSTLPALKATAMRDIFTLLKEYGIYNERHHNKTENTYSFGRAMLEFFSIDDDQKVRGRKRNKLWINEANEIGYDEFQQLNFRTTEQVIMDYNPSDVNLWIYDRVIPSSDCTLIRSTYKDNPFLEQSLVAEIEKLKDEDPEYWTIYGLGERCKSTKHIYTNYDREWRKVDVEPIYGLDFGFNAPTALVEVKILEKDVYLKELIYETKLKNSDVIERMGRLGISPTSEIYADNAEPDRIEEIAEAGFNVFPAAKDVQAGIDRVKRFKLHIHPDSVNLWSELQTYKWKSDKNGEVLDEPVKWNDHCSDGVRYAIYTHLKDAPLTVKDWKDIEFGKTEVSKLFGYM